jgi:hypothetical protein
MKHPVPADPARTGPRFPAGAAVPVCAAAFALPAQRLRDLTRAELAAAQHGDDPAAKHDRGAPQPTTGG